MNGGSKVVGFPNCASFPSSPNIFMHVKPDLKTIEELK